MSNNFYGDPKIIMTKNGADLVYRGGQPLMDKGVENNDIISLFTSPGWVGNSLLSNKIGSRFESVATGSITKTKLAEIENEARIALDIETANTANIDVSVSNPSGSSISVLITREPVGRDVNQLLLTHHGLNWVNQILDPANERL